MRKIRTLPAVIIAVVIVLSASPVMSAKSGQYNMKVGSYVTPQSVWGKAVSKALKAVNKRTGGNVKVKHLHSGMLGSGKNMLDQVLIGGIQGAGVETAILSTMVPQVSILELPYLFRDREEAYFLIDNVIMPEISSLLNKKGIVASSIIENGFMDFVMSGPVRTPADLKTMKIGSWESPVHIAFWKSQGAVPIPIPATEVFNAYARGMVDSGANSASALMAWDKLFGVGLKRDRIYITRSAFTYHAGLLVLNRDYYNSMPEEYRKILKEELDKFTVKLREELAEAEEPSYSHLAQLGYHVGEMTESEREVFVKNSESVYEEMKEEIGAEFLEKVLEERKKYRARKDGGN
ncbi:MAG TPA: TRAP transporter substrate-binding protein DctP [bacterium]|nr:TRAP transporter substrate-binding protein DctP [bacterium]